MAERSEAAESSNTNKDAVKKKKTKRTTSNRKDIDTKERSGMSSSARISFSRSRERDGGGEEQQRGRRSKSTDRKSRRDSGLRRDNKERSGTSNGESAAAAASSKGSSGTGRVQTSSSPKRLRKTKSEGEGARINNKSNSENAGATSGSATKDLSRSRSPSRTLSTGAAPRLPQRTSSDSSNLQAALEATNIKSASKAGDSKKDLEEASLGDFKKYAQQQQQKSRSRFGASKTCMESRSSKMGDIPEESLGSFAAFARNYEQEELMGLHDNPEESQQQEETAAPYSHEQSVSLGGLMSPMQQYGGVPKTPPVVVDESLGSFTAYNKKYEDDKLLGFHDSTMSGLPPPPKKEKQADIPEESMGDFVQLASQEEKTKSKSKKKSGGEEKEKEVDEVLLPSSRIEKLGKRGGIGYKIMVDSPGGHTTEPMKIVVAIEFEDDSDSELELESGDENDEPEEEASPAPPAIPKMNSNDDGAQDSEMNESGHLPMSLLEEEKKQKDRPSEIRKKKQGRKQNESIAKHRIQKMKNWHTDADEEEHSEDDDQARPLGQPMSRWTEQTKRVDPGGLKQPEREKSRSTHSTLSSVSSVSLESMLEGGIRIQTDGCPSNPTFQRKPPGYRSKSAANSALRRQSGAIQQGDTASLLKRAPHNLGTRRGLMLRQQSEASMMSTKSAVSGKSTDSSWVTPNEDEGYQASFMQLNLLELEKPQMQTNEEVEQAELPELPEALLSGAEGISQTHASQENGVAGEEGAATPEGKDPQKASTELLGMKTMLKHIKRVAPKRTKSFEDMPKQVWNSLFARSQKGELPGSQYVDDGDDITDPGEEDQAGNYRNEEGDNDPEAKAAHSPSPNGIFNTRTGKSTGDPGVSNPSERSASKGRSSLWSSAMKRITPGKDSTPQPWSTAGSLSTAGDATPTDDDDDGDGEESIGIDDIGAGVEPELEEAQEGEDLDDGEPSSDRRRSGGKGKESSTRSARTSRIVDLPKKGGGNRTRAARAQQVLNRSLVDTLDYLTAEQEDDDNQDAGNDVDESKRRPNRLRTRRKLPNRTKSDDTTGGGASGRTKSSDGTRPVGRTRSQDNSPIRPNRDAAKKLHKSFSGVDPGDLPSKPRATKRRGSSSGIHGKEARDVGKKMHQSFSGVDPGDLPSRPRATKPRDSTSGQHAKEASGKTKSRDKGLRESGRKPRHSRKKSTEAPPDDPESSGHIRGLRLPAHATEKELRQMLDYG